MYFFIKVSIHILPFILFSSLVFAGDHKLTAGSYHTCVIDDTGVKCWGNNSWGLLRVPTLINPKAISVGSISACAIDEIDIRCWGNNISGQPSFNNPKNISVGSKHACAIDDEGVKCWGSNSDGQTTVPTMTNPTVISSGINHTCAIADEGVKCWGNDSHDKTTVPSLTNPTVISSGTNHTCAIDDNGVKCWGYKGDDITEVPTLINPITVSSGNRHSCAIDDYGIKCWGSDANDMLNVPSLINPRVMSVGLNHTCAIDDDGVKCWGLNKDGQGAVPNGLLFDVDSDNDGVLDVIDLFPDDANETIDTDDDGIGNNADADDDNDGIVDIDDLLPLNKWFAKDSDNDGIPDKWEEKFNLDPQNPSDKHTDLDGDGLSAFEEFNYQTDPNNTDSDKDTLLDGWEVLNGRDPSKSDYDISTIGGVTCAIDDYGPVCWGREWSGKNRLEGLLNASNVSVGGNGHVICFIDDFGGSCKYGGDELNRLTFLKKPKEIGAGYVSCAIDNEGVKCWKDPKSNTQLFHPEKGLTDSINIFSVPNMHQPSNLSVGRNHACVIDDNKVKCWLTWPNNPNDQNEQHIVPELINPKAVAAGMWSTCAIDDEGVKCWGLNNNRQAESPELSNPREISGGQHYCALDDNGISCWGRNIDGEINVPVVKQSTLISAGTDGNWWGSSCSLGIDGIVCWGKSPSFDIQNNNFEDVKLYIDPDGDGFSNQYGKDAFPLDPSEWLDTDLDGIGNNTDVDDDNDEVPDNQDAFPLNSKEWADSDGDTVGDNADVFPNDASETIDTDLDGVGDNSDNCSTVPNAEQFDTDSDTIGNACDNDDDNDGVADASDSFPLDSSEQADSDNDGLGDNYEIINGLDRKNPDIDADGLKDGAEIELGTNPKLADSDDDGVIDGKDKFPLISIGELTDTDSDGAPDTCNEACVALGMAADSDDDNDGVKDIANHITFYTTNNLSPELLELPIFVETLTKPDLIRGKLELNPTIIPDYRLTSYSNPVTAYEIIAGSYEISASTQQFDNEIRITGDQNGRALQLYIWPKSSKKIDGKQVTTIVFTINLPEDFVYEAGQTLVNVGDLFVLTNDRFNANGLSIWWEDSGRTGNLDLTYNSFQIADAYPLIPIGELTDTDSDGAPDTCNEACIELGMAADTDDDNDGVVDTADAYPLIAIGELIDTDSDGAPDTCDEACVELSMAADNDDDNDGVLDTVDIYPLVAIGELTDTDADGAPDNCDETCVELGMLADTTNNLVFVTGAYGGAVFEFGTYIVPSGLPNDAGFINANNSLYPISFPSGGNIELTGFVPDGTSVDVYFRFEYQKSDENDFIATETSFETSKISITGNESQVYTVAIDAQASNTFNSVIMYILDRDVAVNITNIVITPNEVVSLSELFVGLELISVSKMNERIYAPKETDFLFEVKDAEQALIYMPGITNQTLEAQWEYANNRIMADVVNYEPVYKAASVNSNTFIDYPDVQVAFEQFCISLGIAETSSIQVDSTIELKTIDIQFNSELSMSTNLSVLEGKEVTYSWPDYEVTLKETNRYDFKDVLASLPKLNPFTLSGRTMAVPLHGSEEQIIIKQDTGEVISSINESIEQERLSRFVTQRVSFNTDGSISIGNSVKGIWEETADTVIMRHDSYETHLTALTEDNNGFIGLVKHYQGESLISHGTYFVLDYQDVDFAELNLSSYTNAWVKDGVYSLEQTSLYELEEIFGFLFINDEILFQVSTSIDIESETWNTDLTDRWHYEYEKRTDGLTISGVFFAQRAGYYRSRNWEVVSFNSETKTLYVLERQFTCWPYYATEDGMNQCAFPLVIPSTLQRYRLVDLTVYEPYSRDPDFNFITEVANALVNRAEDDGVNIDQDSDGILDVFDLYPLVAIGGLLDTDSDGAPDTCDEACVELGMAADNDDDNDGILDTNDRFPLISIGELLDTDGDGAPDECDEACLALGMKADRDGIPAYTLLEQPQPQFATLTPTAKIIVTGSQGDNFFDIARYVNEVSVVGQTFLFSGSSEVDGVIIQPGVKYDLTNLKGSIDKLHFSGPLSEYADSILLDTATGVMQLSRLTDIGEEIVQFIATSSASDLLVFTDGALSAADIKAAVTSDTLLTDLTLDTTIKALDDKSTTGATVKHIVLNNNGAGVMALGPNISTLISGSSGVDQIYVPAGSNVDASNLKSSQDEIYLQGNLADYTSEFDSSGNIILSRDVVVDDETQSERVILASGGNAATNDLVIFKDQQVDTATLKQQVLN